MANVYLNKENDLATSNIKSERQQFSISDMSIIINLLTKLYSNPIATLTQEYISNGRDANREVSSKRPLEITVPTTFSPTMKIRDFGPGLTPERIEKTFLFYGASTKRKDNGQLGGFGIGAKSAWSYTDSFNIVTFVNGVKRTYVAHKSNGNGNLDLISTEATTEPNGTEIVIGVANSDVNAFKNAIKRTIMFWEKSERPILYGVTKEETNFYKNPKYTMVNLEILHGSYGREWIVVDGIPYQNKGYTPELSRLLVSHNYIINVPSGKVNIAPTREDLIDDDTTKNYLKQVDKDIAELIRKDLDTKVNNMAKAIDSFKQVIELKTMFNFDFEYKNYLIEYGRISCLDPNSISAKAATVLRIGNTYELRRGKLQRSDTYSILFEDLSEKTYLDDMPKEPWTKKVWRVKKVLKDKIILLKHDLDQSIIDDLQPIKLSTIDASDYSVNSSVVAGRIVKKDICLHYFNGYKMNKKQVELKDITKKVVYSLLDDSDYVARNTNEVNKWIEIIKQEGYNYAFIAKSVENTIKNDTNFISLKDFKGKYNPSEQAIKNHIKLLLESTKIFLFLKNTKDDINDKGIKFFIDIVTTPKTYVGEGDLPKDVKGLMDHKLYKDYLKYKNIDTNFFKKYPVFCLLVMDNSLSNKSDYTKDIVSYINSK